MAPQYRCIRYGTCGLADQRAVIASDTGDPPICPECGGPLKPETVESPRHPATWMPLGVWAILLMAALGGLAWTTWVPKPEPSMVYGQGLSTTGSGVYGGSGLGYVNGSEKPDNNRKFNPDLSGLIEVAGPEVRAWVANLSKACLNGQTAIGTCFTQLPSVKMGVTPDRGLREILMAVGTLRDRLGTGYSVGPEQIRVVGHEGLGATEDGARLKAGLESESGGTVKMDFLDRQEVAALAFAAALELFPLPHYKPEDIVFLEVGKSASFGAYRAAGESEARTTTFDLEWGFKNYADEVAYRGFVEGFAQASKRLENDFLMPIVREMVERKPGIIHRRAMYLAGQGVWAAAMLLHATPEMGKIGPRDLEKARRRLAEPGVWREVCADSQYRFDAYAQSLCQTLSQDEVLAGIDLLRAFAEEMKFGSKEVYVLRDTAYLWPLGYLKARYGLAKTGGVDNLTRHD